MIHSALFLAALSLTSSAHAQTTFTEDSQITGQVGVQTFQPRARMEVRMAAGDEFALRVSSQNGDPLLTLDKAGRLGVGLSSAHAHIDVTGSGDSGDLGLQIRMGNSSSSISSSQIAFAYNSTETFRHSIRTSHVATQDLENSIDFFLWRSTGQAASLGIEEVLSLQAIPTASSGSAHIIPYGTPDVELEVSNGVTTGGGTIHRAASGTHSSRAIKTDILYFGTEFFTEALRDVQSLHHVWFRYKREMTLHRGLIYEDVPKSIQGEGKSVVLDYRVLNLEAALKEVDRRIIELEAKIARAEQSKRPR